MNNRRKNARVYLIENLLPQHTLHLVAGPSGAGKTTWLLDMLHRFVKGQKVLGNDVHPCRVAYVSADRDLDEINETLDGLGIDDPGFEIHSLLDLATTPDISQIPHEVCDQKPDLLVIEGFATFAERTSDYRSVAEYCNRIRKMCRSLGITIIGTVHETKTKKTERFENPRERVLGSVAWAGYSGTIFVIEMQSPDNVADQKRLLTVLPRHRKPFSVTLLMQGGKLIESASYDDNTTHGLTILTRFAEGSQITKYDLANSLPTMGLMNVENTLKRLAEAGQLVSRDGVVYELPGQVPAT